jgi:transcriptional regulator with PAS, ATPase and Fis domain
VMDLIRQVGPTNVTVFIRGESGTGKELVARAIHAGGPRRYFPLVPVNCGALPESLLESELFGHEKGAFTGAQYQRKGKIELADGGTLFLDEIGTVSPKTQVDLLRVLETKTFTRVGGTRTVRSDFRVICATNQDLQEMIDAGTFRRDLFFRINVFPIDLPSLRDRRDDIPRLAEHFLKKYASQMEKRVTGISPEALDTLGGHDWPGNVRELENAIERALVVGKHGMLQACDLPFGKTGRADEPAGESLADVERGHIARVLDRCEWNISRAARILQVDRATLYNKIARYGLRK